VLLLSFPDCSPTTTLSFPLLQHPKVREEEGVGEEKGGGRGEGNVSGYTTESTSNRWLRII